MIKKIKYIYFPQIKNNISAFYYLIFARIRMFFFMRKSRNRLSCDFDGELIFLVEKPQTIIFRLAKWLKRTSDRKISLAVNSDKLFFDKDSCFDNIIKYRNLDDLIYKLSKVKVYIVHAFAPPSKVLKGLILKTKYKIIGDWKDISLNYHGFNPPYKYLRNDLPNEKFSLENSHGIIARSLEPKIAARRYQIELNQPKLLFLEYCDNDEFVEDKNRTYFDKGEIHLTYIGNISGLNTNDPGNLYDVIKSMNDQEIYLHLYPSQRVNESIVDSYRKLSFKFENLLIHEPVGINDLAKEISKYHFGLQPFFTLNVERLKYKRKGSTSMKLFNYLEAELPIIIGLGPEYQNYLVNRYNIGVNINISELQKLRDIIVNLDYDRVKKNIRDLRLKLSLENNINRLTNFYSVIFNN